MALSNTSHNLTEPHSTEQQTPGIKRVLPSLSLDETIEQIMGGFGWSQFLQAILVSVPTFFDAQQTFISIYTDAEPKWHFNFSTTCNRCQISKSDWSWPSWDESSQKTIISDWGLECASSFMIGLHASSFFIGSLIGGFTLAMLGDIFLGGNVNPYKLMKELFKRRWDLQRVLASMVLGFGIGVAFFGMLFGVQNLGYNIYLSVIFNGSLLLPSNSIPLFFIARWKRKISLFAFCIISGICSILCAIVGRRREGIQIGLELASLFFSCLGYNLLLIFTIELFPTVRNTASTLARQAVVFGSALDPILTSAGRRNEFLSFGIFGLSILLCGFIVIVLPETKGKNLCNTMDEQEQKESTTV
uniref:Uncharacterized protein n=1 Tax=Quercus lobata TaxID=97700 RepID=A0A7N2LJG5_QUELO